LNHGQLHNAALNKTALVTGGGGGGNARAMEADLARLTRERRSLEQPLNDVDAHIRNIDRLASGMRELNGQDLVTDQSFICALEPELAEVLDSCEQLWTQMQTTHSALTRRVNDLRRQWEELKQPRLAVLAYVRAKEQAAEMCVEAYKTERQRVRARRHASSSSKPPSTHKEDAARPAKTARLDFYNNEGFQDDDDGSGAAPKADATLTPVK
jgi:chromosome segregation ATPase